MGQLNIVASTGVSVISDDATALLNDVVKGKTALTSDSNDDLGVGTLELTGNTNPNHVLVSNTFYTTDPHAKQVGIMPNNPAQNATLSCGQSKVIPAGYTPGGTIVAASLVSQTGGATATDAYVRSGYTYWKDGIKRTGTMTVSSVVSFSVAAYSTSQVIVTWKNPAKGPYSGVVICAKSGGYPTSINDNRKYTGTGSNSALSATSSVTIGGLNAGSTYYFRLWVYCSVSSGDMYGNYAQTTCTPTAHGRQSFTSSSTFTVPAGVRTIDIFCVGGGAGGGNGAREASGDFDSGGGGGSGYTTTKKEVAVVPGNSLTVTVGSGGNRGSSYNNQNIGSLSSVSLSGSELCSASGGTRRDSGAYKGACGGTGGSGGGGGITDSYTSYKGGGGGSDGSNSIRDWTANVHQYITGVGQGTTTREFSESTGTLYAGGGGAGGNYSPAAPGGSGGGGEGGLKSGNKPGSNGSYGTGGGGGGGGYCNINWSTMPAYVPGGSGGSGAVIIRW